MADPKLPQKLIRENPFKRLVTRLVLLAFLNQNLAFATQSIIELDFKDSQTPQRFHVIPRMSNVGDVSHIEIDTKQKQAAVYLKEKQEEALDEVEKPSFQGGDVPVTPKPVILQKHDIINLPWDLEPEKLTLFILDHTAWLSPLDEDGYKLEFRGKLLGGGGVQSTGGGGGSSNSGGGGQCRPSVWSECDNRGNCELNITVCNTYSNNYNSNDHYVSGHSGNSRGNGSTGGYGSSVISNTGNGSRTSPIDALQEQGIFLNRPLSGNDYIKKNAFLPKDYVKDILLDDALLQVVIDYNKGLSSPMKIVLEPLGYIARQDLRNILNYVAVSKDYLSPLTKNELQHRFQSLFDLHIQYVSPDCWGVGPGSNCFHWGQIQKQNKNSAISKVLAPRLMSKGLNLIMTNGETLSGKTGRDAPKWGENSHHALSVFHPSTGLAYPVFAEDRGKVSCFLPVFYTPTSHADYLVNETGKILTKGNGLPYTENAVSIAYLVTGLLREVLEDTARSSQSIYTKDGFEKRLKEATRLHHNFSGITFSKKPGGMDSETFMTTFLLPRVQNMAFSLGGSSKSLRVSSVSGFSQGLNRNNDLSLFSALTQLHYPVFKEGREKSGIFLPKNYEVTPHADYLVTETAKIVERNHIPDTGGVVAFAYVTNNTLREVLEEAARSSTSVYTKDGFNKRLKEAFLLHNQYAGNQSLPKVGGTNGMDAQVFMIQELMPRLAGMALGLGGSSKTLLLSSFPGLLQSFNGNGDVSIYSAFTNIHYPVFAEDRGKEGSLLPSTYKPTKESEYLLKYTKGYVVDANKIKHHVEELQAIGYLVHEAMEQAVEDCRNGDAWDKQEFYTCLKAMTLHHLQMSGAEWVNTKMGGYFTEQLLPRIIYQAAFHHARIPANKEPFDDQVMQGWLKTDWVGLVKQVAKMQKIDPMAPHDYFDLEGKMGGVGLMGGGAGGGKLGWNRLMGKYNKSPGLPTANDGFVAAKNWNGKLVKNPNGKGQGYPDKDGNVWVPTGVGGSQPGTTGIAHGGAHWDVQLKNGKHQNVYPGGKTR